MSKRHRYFFPQDEKEYQKELEENSQEWKVLELYKEAVAQGYTPDKDNKITVVDTSGDYKIEFRAIKSGKVHKVIMKDLKNRIERYFGVTNNQRHGLYMELKNGKVVRMGSYMYNKPYGKLCTWDDEKDDFKTIDYFD